MKRLRNLEIGLIACGVLSLLVAYGLWHAYRITFDGPLASDQQAWGLLGDYFGGMAGSVFAVLSFLALLFTIYIQSSELAESREQLRRSADAQDRATEFGRLGALLALRSNYLELMSQKGKLLEAFRGMSAESQVMEIVADLDTRLREVNGEIMTFHQKAIAK